MNFRIERPTRFVRLVLATQDALKTFATMGAGFMAAVVAQVFGSGWAAALCAVVLTIGWQGLHAIIDRVASWILWGRDLG